MAGDLNREASELWNSLKPIIDKEIDARTQGMVQRRKAKVTTAPSLATNTIGVTEPFGTEMFLPFNTNIMSASVGDFVWVEYMYGMTNAFVSMFASADDKDKYVAGNLTVLGNTSIGGVLDVANRRAQAGLSSPGWYRVLTYTGTSAYQPDGATGALIRFNIVVYGSTSVNGNHQIDLSTAYGTGHREFVNEFSNGQDTLVDKIRYTKSGNNFYVDVHFTGNANNTVAVYFDPMIAVAFRSRITANNLVAVADAPSGETVVTTYEFSQTGVHVGDVFSNGIQLFGLLSGGTAITANADLNNYTTPGVYTCTPTVAATLTNSSFTTVGFKMLVMDNVTDTMARWQICLASYDNCILAFRWRNGNGVWQAWKRLTPA